MPAIPDIKHVIFSRGGPPVLATQQPTTPDTSAVYVGAQCVDPIFFRQYQIETSADVFLPPPVSAAAFAQPLSLPIRPKFNLAPYLRNAGAAVEKVWIEAVVSYQPSYLYPKPQLARHLLPPSPTTLIPLAPPPTPAVFVGGQSVDPIFIKNVLLETEGRSYIRPEQITVDKWFQNLSQPLRRKFVEFIYQNQANVFPIIIPSDFLAYDRDFGIIVLQTANSGALALMVSDDGSTQLLTNNTTTLAILTDNVGVLD